MRSFEIILLRERGQFRLSVEKLDPWPDTEGYERYLLTAPEVACTISLDAHYWSRPVLLNAADAETYYEQVHYPAQRPFFSDGNAFTTAELRQIAEAIAKYRTYGTE